MDGSNNLEACQSACQEDENCSAINFYKTGGCTLRACPYPVPAPSWRLSDHVGYYKLSAPAPTTGEPQKGCTIAEVGSSWSSSKSITIDDGFKCPTTVDQTNWLDGHHFGNTFLVAQNGSRVTITRSDQATSWGMDLRFMCCPEKASESNKDWCCKVVMVHGNTPGESWGRLELDAPYYGDEGLRKEWDNKGCSTLVAKGGDGHNTNNCPLRGSPGLFSNKVWCCGASDLYKGKEKGGFNTIDLKTKTTNHPVKKWWYKKRCYSHVSNCSDLCTSDNQCYDPFPFCDERDGECFA